MATDSELLYEVKDRIATITLNRPDKLNAFTGPMIDRWAASLNEAQRDPNVNVVVVTGAGKAFCSGGDVGRMGAGNPTPLDNKNGLWEHIHRVPKALEAMDKPVIAMVNGVAVGAGMGMSLMCDMRIASDAARFSTGYVRVGLVPGDGDTYFLPRLIGTARALELLWTADFIEAPKALELGIVNRVVPADKLDGGDLRLRPARRRRPADTGPDDQAAGLPVHAPRPAHAPRPGVVAHGGGARDRGPQGRRAGLQGQAPAEVQRTIGAREGASGHEWERSPAVWVVVLTGTVWGHAELSAFAESAPVREFQRCGRGQGSAAFEAEGSRGAAGADRSQRRGKPRLCRRV